MEETLTLALSERKEYTMQRRISVLLLAILAFAAVSRAGNIRESALIGAIEPRWHILNSSQMTCACWSPGK